MLQTIAFDRSATLPSSWSITSNRGWCSMKNLLLPDIVALLLPISLVGLCLFLAMLLVSPDKPALRVSLIACAGAVIPSVFAIIWQQTPLRFYTFRFFYRRWGPTCRIRVLGDIPVDPGDDDELLTRLFGVIQKSMPEAELLATFKNRRVISNGRRTLTIDAVKVDLADDEETTFLALEYPDEIDEQDEHILGGGYSDRRVAFDLAGYEGKLTEMDSLLQDEVALLLERINTDIKRQDAQPMFSMRVVIDGSNPFFVFYLKDMPTTRIEKFRLNLVVGGAEDFVAVDASPEYVNVSARSPTRLLTAARQYLASPILGRN